ncbi:MAG: ATP-dependent helicase [Patescibacteria group bacterium]
MTSNFDESFIELSPIQRDAVNWGDGALLVLAGPGAGKTRVLTTRIAKLISDNPERKFKILALTFTTKAASEMHDRVETLIPGVVDNRTFIGTFHAYCTQILRQHGSHINIHPDFSIFSQREDQEALLLDAINYSIKQGKKFSIDDVKLLDTIKILKSRLIVPEKTLLNINNPHLKEVYELYEQALKSENGIDFEGLILETCRLLAKMPAISARIRQSYPYWLIDEFQDTSPSQYWLLHYLAGDQFKNIFVVADDDQIIYHWAGASYRQIEKFREEYKPELIQLVENHRCPPEIVDMANQLVAYNTQRTPDKKPTTPGRDIPLDAVQVKIFGNDRDEYASISNAIYLQGEGSWGKTIILGRTKSLLESMIESLKLKGVRAVISQRRDNFISPQFIWLQAMIDQIIHPTNKRIFNIFAYAANRVCGLEFDPILLIAEAESVSKNYIEHWSEIVMSSDNDVAKKLGSLIQQLIQSRQSWKKIVKDAISTLLETGRVTQDAVSDADDDYRAWTACLREIQSEIGQDLDLSDVVQGIALRSKEPPIVPNTVTLMTIHAAKGLEFEIVYIIGLAEGEMPSWQSCKKGDTSPEMEEERRNCFVAITRTQEKLVLSSSGVYRGFEKKSSRFLKEMKLIS